jgi:hypothetical protein
MTRVVILGGPKTGKTTLANHLAHQHAFDELSRTGLHADVVPPRHTDDLIDLGWSAGSQRIADEWLTQPGPWIIEGVACSRALRKWRAAHPDEPPPVDRVIRLTTPYVALSSRQAGMAKGEEHVWQEIEQWLLSAPDGAVEEHGGLSSHVVA